jgi:anti-sigma B factor antagonist
VAFRISTRQVGDVTILDLSGRITLAEGAIKLRDAVRDAVAKRARKILLNMGEVTYIDSTGIGEITAALATIKDAGGQLKFCDLGKKVHDLLHITKLYTVYGVVDDEKSAIEAFANLDEFRCECPICGESCISFGKSGARPSLRYRCGNCRADCWVSHSDSASVANIESLRIQTYSGEQIRVLTGKFLTATIDGRLDLFVLTTLRKIWDRIPGVQKLIIDLSCTTDIDDDGWEGLHLLLQSTAERIQAVVSLEYARSKVIAGRVIAPPIYAKLATARKALGSNSSKLIWHVKTLNLKR